MTSLDRGNSSYFMFMWKNSKNKLKLFNRGVQKGQKKFLILLKLIPS